MSQPPSLTPAARLPCDTCLLALLLCASVALATPVSTPLTLPGATVVSAEQARALIAKGVTVIDTRTPYEYVEAHIPGAASVPYEERSAKTPAFNSALDRFDLARLPRDKRTALLFYCNGGECWKSYKASRTALRAGYIHVYWLRGGLPEWKARGLPLE